MDDSDISEMNWMIKQRFDSSVGVQVIVNEHVLGADLEEQVLFASALEMAVAQGLLVQCHCAGNDSTFQLTWSGMVEARKHMECGIDCD